MGDNKKWSAANATALLWVALHFYASVHAFMHGLYQTYTIWSWVLLTVWLLGLLALDARLYAGGRRGLLRFVKWYWAFSAAMAAAVILAGELDLIHDVNGCWPLRGCCFNGWRTCRELSGTAGAAGRYCSSA